MYASRAGQRGGTLIAEAVVDLAAHLRLVCDPNGYRPAECGHCGGSTLHCHDRRERKLRGAEDWPPVVEVLRYRCVNLECHAVWRVLPGFLARHLWRAWAVVEVATGAVPASTRRVSIPARTFRRWRGRLFCSALLLVQVLATSGAAWLSEVVAKVGLGATRAELVAAFSAQPGSLHALAEVAGLIHRLAPGVRLM